MENLAAAPLPVDDRTGPEGRLDWRFLDLRRHPAGRLVFEVQTTAHIREACGHEFVFVTGYPAAARPFYRGPNRLTP